MKVSDYKFSEEEIPELEKYRDSQKDFRLKIRFTAVLMIARGSDTVYTASVIGKSVQTVENWIKIYISEGTGGLNSFRYKPKRPSLNMYEIHDVIIWVTYTNPSGVREVVRYIEDRFGVYYCDEAVRKILRKYGLKVIRPRKIPGNPPSAEEQKEFVEKYENMKTLSEQGSVILFTDAMHPVHQSVPSACRGDPLFPPVLPSNSGRSRLNIPGAYNPAALSLIHLAGEENCNADRVLQFFELIAKSYPDAPEIHLISDNAKYFYAGKVFKRLENHNKIILHPLPPYAPNLNLIERLWKFAKKKLVKNKYYEKYKTFRATVFQFLNNINQYKDELKRLMTEKSEIVYA